MANSVAKRTRSVCCKTTINVASYKDKVFIPYCNNCGNLCNVERVRIFRKSRHMEQRNHSEISKHVVK